MAILSMMETSDPRARLAALVADSGHSLGALSRMLRRNDAYLQQYVKRGTPRVLAERDRRLLAAFLRVDERELGGPAPTAPPMASVRRLDIAASAGPGALAEREERIGTARFDPHWLAQLGVDPSHAAEIRASGDSMAPLIEDGDLMLIDERDRSVGGRPGIFVIRLDNVLVVKRVRRDGDILHIESVNPAAQPIAPRGPASVTIIGRVVWLSRTLR